MATSLFSQMFSLFSVQTSAKISDLRSTDEPGGQSTAEIDGGEVKKSPTIIKVGGDNLAFESGEGRGDPPGVTTNSAAMFYFQRYHESHK